MGITRFAGSYLRHGNAPYPLADALDTNAALLEPLAGACNFGRATRFIHQMYHEGRADTLETEFIHEIPLL